MLQRRAQTPLLQPALGCAFIGIALLTYPELTVPVLLSCNDNLPRAVDHRAALLRDRR